MDKFAEMKKDHLVKFSECLLLDFLLGTRRSDVAKMTVQQVFDFAKEWVEENRERYGL